MIVSRELSTRGAGVASNLPTALENHHVHRDVLGGTSGCARDRDTFGEALGDVLGIGMH